MRKSDSVVMKQKKTGQLISTVAVVQIVMEQRFDNVEVKTWQLIVSGFE
jgi:hypothetical protein